MKLLILLAALPFVSAAQTYTVAETPEYVTALRLDGVKKSGTNATAWLLTDYRAARPDGTKSAQELVEVDCSTAKWRMLSSAYYSSSGRALGSGREQPWDQIAPSSTIDTVRKAICGGR